MRLTILVPDDIVIIDGEPKEIDCSSLTASKTHAVQWMGTSGWIEYVNEPGKEYKPHKAIISIGEFQQIIDAWNAQSNPEPPPPLPGPNPPPPSANT